MQQSPNNNLGNFQSVENINIMHCDDISINWKASMTLIFFFKPIFYRGYKSTFGTDTVISFGRWSGWLVDWIRKYFNGFAMKTWKGVKALWITRTHRFCLDL